MITFSESQQKIIDTLEGETIEQNTIPLSVLQEIRQEIDNISKDEPLDDYDCGFNTAIYKATKIIDKHIKEIEV